MLIHVKLYLLLLQLLILKKLKSLELFLKVLLLVEVFFVGV